MSDARRYAVWPDRRSRSRSRALQSLKTCHFQHLSPPPFYTTNFLRNYSTKVPEIFHEIIPEKYRYFSEKFRNNSAGNLRTPNPTNRLVFRLTG